MKKGYKGAIEKLALENENFRTLVYTAEHCQLVLMSLLPGEEIGVEVHKGGDQFFRFEKGTGMVVINETEYAVEGGDAVIVPMGASHNVINTSKTESLKMYTLYAPPHHRDGVVHHSKADAQADHEHFGGKITE
jgi:mannose-6-phosphate isomerase-like protein (cupin superfamily)